MINSSKTQEGALKSVPTLLRWLPRMGRGIWLGFCGLLVCVLMADIVELHVAPQDYAMLFGSDALGGMWHYASKTAYIAHALLLVVWGAVGMLCALNRKPFQRSWMLAIHVVLSLAYLASVQL